MFGMEMYALMEMMFVAFIDNHGDGKEWVVSTEEALIMTSLEKV